MHLSDKYKQNKAHLHSSSLRDCARNGLFTRRSNASIAITMEFRAAGQLVSLSERKEDKILYSYTKSTK